MALISMPPDLQAAEALWKSGRFLDAWSQLDDLPPEHRAGPEALDLPLRLCVALEKWQLGADLARVLSCAANASHHITTAEFLHAYARHLVRTGEPGRAHDAIREAVAMWKPIRIQIIEDDLLAELW